MTATSMVKQRESSESCPLTTPLGTPYSKPATSIDNNNSKNNNGKNSDSRERTSEWPQPPMQVGLAKQLLEYLLFRSRWVFVIAFVLPVSLAYDCYHMARLWLVMKLQSAPAAHTRKVAIIQRQIQDWNKAGRRKRMCTARTGHLTMCFRYPKYKDHMLGIKTDRLVDILEIDTVNRQIRVEPMVTMGQLTRVLLPLGFTLPVVPELDDLTVGGIINGCGVESSGCKYGLFQHSCLSYEIITSNGELVLASKENESKDLLFYGIPWSHGTLGFLVAATIRIIPCKPYVRLAYSPSFSQFGLAQKLRLEAARPDNDFIDAIQFNEREACVMVGQFAEKVDATVGPLNEIGRWHKQWFFKHVEAIQKSGKSHVEYIPLRDYYHRHSRSIFWELQDIIPFGNHWLFRWLFGWAVPPKISLLKQTMLRPIKNLYDRHHILQDLMIPITHLELGLDLIRDRTRVYPLWLCPFILPSQMGLLRNNSGLNRLYVDVGIYGNCSLPSYHPVETTRALEAFTRDVQGVQMLYADCYQKCEEFWEMFDASLYDWLRCKYDCKQAFPNVYEKTCRNARD